ncbi:Pentatricopeptide repeat-containing protein [Rhynchospora pubera]|uniref:Pentatricopeptide repeat-containing protein n=1 Tax=Rhynchospora pubera TaxID=906938 RepID=A0AAV8D8I9_9POAL|nr:Pentatricopeptide repeat-containing protein [Rhynchospora pubera]
MLSSLSPFQNQRPSVSSSPQLSPCILPHNCSSTIPLYKRTHKHTLKSQAFPTNTQLYPGETAPFLHSISTSMTQTHTEDFVDISTLVVSYLRSCTTLAEVKRVHGLSVRLFLTHLKAVSKDLMYAYIRVQQLKSAQKVFDGMSNRDVVAYTMLLEAYRLMGLGDEVLKLFKDMLHNGIEASSYTYVCLLKLCGEWCDFDLGSQLHACVIKGDCMNIISESVLVYFYSQCADITSATKVFDRMFRRDVVAWTTIITAYVQHGSGQEAFSMLSAMQDDGFSPNEFTISSVLKACGDQKAMKCGQQLHGAIVKGKYKDDVYVGSSLLTMYARCGAMSDAQLVFNKMPRRNSSTWTSIIFGYAQNGLGYEAILLFQKMKNRRLWALSETILGILYACGSLKSLYIVKEIHAQVIKNHFSENIRFATTLIWVYCKCYEYGYAEKVLERMPERDAISWTAMISGYKNLGHNIKALELLPDMLWDGVQPNHFTYSSALSACAKVEVMRYGQWIHAFVNKHEQTLSNVFVGSSLLDMYMKCGDVRNAQMVFDKMAERNLVTWKLLILGYVNNGRCRDALKLMQKMQEEGLDVDEFVRGIVIGAFGDVQLEMPIGSIVER